ncbi:hypothetical protein [Marivirga arenosa]|uniref:Uncharacterized protein n=1 Tax=Marivirga arenosa TaxID=3059076 RepID=A0AA49GIF9_9BACT|nr:hypothetical protein [Marivirga sp. BKB1-2]WKK79943.1 hypothetical protein QYS47_22205 [Marivirga sp. BKB1-2]
MVISKYGFPFSDKENFDMPTYYWQKKTLGFRVNRTNEVRKHIQKNIIKPRKIVVDGT